MVNYDIRLLDLLLVLNHGIVIGYVIGGRLMCTLAYVYM
jgi:hypothetical protein